MRGFSNEHRKKKNLLVHILSQIETAFVSDLDPTDMQGVYNGLNCLGCASGGRGKREHPKVWILRHEVANDLGICVIACALVRFVYIMRLQQNISHKLQKVTIPMTIRIISRESQFSVVRSLMSV